MSITLNNNSLPYLESTDLQQVVLETNNYSRGHFGFYRGIVIQNNDPERSGRVKVLVPSLAPTIYDNWLIEKDEKSDQEDAAPKFKDKKFRFPAGVNLYDQKSWPGPIIDEFRIALPWAEQASSLIGTGSNGLLSGAQDKRFATICSASNGKVPPDDKENDSNVDNINEKPGYKYECDPEQGGIELKDGFTSLDDDKMPEINFFSKSYKPSTYSNITNGMFSLPQVGAVVWVFFDGGDLNFPVYFAYSYDKQDWNSIFEMNWEQDNKNNGLHYPDFYENNQLPVSPLRRNKLVFNSKAGSLEFVDTDFAEQIKLSHYCGSFIHLTNNATVFYSDANEQRLVSKDQFETVNLTKNTRVKRNYNVGVDENMWIRIGSWSDEAVEAYRAWKQTNESISNNRARFPIMRSPPSPQGSFAPNPILYESTPIVDSPEITKVYEILPSAAVGVGGNQCSTLVTATEPVLTQRSQQQFLNLTPEEFYGAAGIFGSQNFIGEPERSASTQEGRWPVDPEYKGIAQQEEQAAAAFLDAERKFGPGGDDIKEIIRHKVEVIGVETNDAPVVRVDPIGRNNFNEVLISTQGAFPSQKPSPLVERVPNDGKFPCGNYTLVIGNAFSVTAGAGGMQFHTLGCIDVSGEQIVVAGEKEIIMSSGGDIKVATDHKFEITADIISFRQKNGRQVGIDGSLGIKNNLIVAGGAYIEGELFVHHITAPIEIQETEETILYGTTTSKIIGHVWLTGTQEWMPVYGGVINTTSGQLSADSDCVKCVPHSHNFKNIPLTLKYNNEGVRTSAFRLNKGDEQVGASPIRNMKKGEAFDNPR